MDESELSTLLPKSKHDTERAEILVQLGFPAGAPILPEPLHNRTLTPITTLCKADQATIKAKLAGNRTLTPIYSVVVPQPWEVRTQTSLPRGPQQIVLGQICRARIDAIRRCLAQQLVLVFRHLRQDEPRACWQVLEGKSTLRVAIHLPNGFWHVVGIRTGRVHDLVAGPAPPRLHEICREGRLRHQHNVLAQRRRHALSGANGMAGQRGSARADERLKFAIIERHRDAVKRRRLATCQQEATSQQ